MKTTDRLTPKTKKPTAELKIDPRRVRISAAQFQMSPIKIWDDLHAHIEVFVKAAVENHSHFLLMPETFTAQLFSTMPFEWTDTQMIRALADMTDAYLDAFSELSQQHDLFIIAGSHPVFRPDGRIYNVAHLFSPAGNVYTQDKLHITPKEVRLWDMHGGNKISLFDTPYGRIGIQICYDIEFPEVARLMALEGAEIIFVPFSTEDQRGYQRVRSCAQARATENYIYTAIAGSCGTIPVPSYQLNYAQSAILSPSDNAFPDDAVIAVAEPGTEITIHAEVELGHLASRREAASVHPLNDRRLDVYELKTLVPIEVIKVE